LSLGIDSDWFDVPSFHRKWNGAGLDNLFQIKADGGGQIDAHGRENRISLVSELRRQAYLQGFDWVYHADSL
jgi:hypothetical protein